MKGGFKFLFMLICSNCYYYIHSKHTLGIYLKNFFKVLISTYKLTCATCDNIIADREALSPPNYYGAVITGVSMFLTIAFMFSIISITSSLGFSDEIVNSMWLRAIGFGLAILISGFIGFLIEMKQFVRQSKV